MNGANVIAAPVIANPGTAWQAIGAGAFTGDGFSDDILWRNTDGTIAIWEMNGATVTAAPVVANPGTSWHPIPGSGSSTTVGGSSGAASASSAAAALSSTPTRGGAQSSDAAFGFGDIADPIPAGGATAASAGIVPASQSSARDPLLLPPEPTPLVDPRGTLFV